MNPEFEYLLSELFVYTDPELGPSIKVADFEHMDYIDDVLTDKFKLEFESSTIDDKARKYILHFGTAFNKENLDKAIKEINLYHASRNSTYKTNFNNQ
jgi:hypothetical protein